MNETALKRENSSQTSTTHKKRLYLQLLLVLLALGSLFLLASKWNSQQSISKITITGNKIISVSEIENKIFVNNFHLPAIDVELSQIRERVQSHSFVKYANVFKKNSDVIEVEITERKPVAYLLDDTGTIRYTDETGSVFAYRIYNEMPDLPVISGVAFHNKICNEALAGALEIINQSKLSNMSLISEVSEIIYEPVSHSYRLLVTDRGYEIVLGQTRDLNNKMEMLSKLWKSYLTKQSTCVISNIDLRWNEKVVVKFKKV
ncbi:MAG: cell division protein FtsQ/DivIB [Bacteroidota bacterium]